MSLAYLFIYLVFSFIVMGSINYLILKKPIKKVVVKEKNTELVSEERSTSQTSDVPLGKVLFVLIFGMFLVILNQTVLNVALPVMMTDLNVNATTAQWLMTGFMLVNGMLIPLSAYLVETFGFRKLFLFSMISFTIGSIICSVSDSFSLVMTGRIIQAIGAGIIMPLGMNIFMTVFPPEKRGAAMGTMGIAMILAPAIGPTLSGWVVQNYDWHYMFYGMVVIGLINIALIFSWFHLERELSKPSFDLVGMIYSSIGFGSLLYGFSEAGSKGWSSAVVISTLLIGVIFIAMFIIRQARMEEPLLDVRVFKYKMFSFTLIINSIITMAMFGGMLLLPMYLQNIRGFSPVESGLLLLPGALIMGVMGPVAGKIFDKYGIRALAIIGMLITTYATFEFTKLSIDTPYHTIMAFYILRSFGMSLLMMTIMTAGMNSLPHNLLSHGTAMSNTIRQVAGSIGSALLVTVMTQQSTKHLGDYANNITSGNDNVVRSLSDLSNHVSVAANLPTEAANSTSMQLLMAQLSKQTVISGINDAFLVATGIASVGLLLAFFLKNKKVEKVEKEAE